MLKIKLKIPRSRTLVTLVTLIPSGFSDLNLTGSAAAAAHQDGARPDSQEVAQQPRNVPQPLVAGRQRKRRRGGRTSREQGGSRGGQSPLDKALASFLTWQRSAEERLLSLEEARLERELQAEERREQREERRAEQERQHELRLFGMITGVLAAGRPQTPAPPPTAPPPPAASSVTPSSTRPTAPKFTTSEEATTAATPTASATACAVAADAPATVAKAALRSLYLSKRGNSILQQQGILQEGFIQYDMDRYHHTDNPDVSLVPCKHSALRSLSFINSLPLLHLQGIINLGTSENKLCYDLLHTRVRRTQSPLSA